MGDRILVPVDGSTPSERAATYAAEQFPDAEIVLLFVMDPIAEYSRQRAFPGYRDADEFSSERDKADHVFETIRAELPGDPTVETEVMAGKPERAIVDYADEHDVDQVVIGSHGRTGPARHLLGSVAETVVRRAPVPVTVVRPPA